MKSIKSLLCVLLFAIMLVTIVPSNVYAKKTTATTTTTQAAVSSEYTDPDANGTSEYFNDTDNVGDNFCSEPSVKKVGKFIGLFILIAKMFVPMIIIVRGFFIFFKAVTSQNDSDLKKSAIEFGKKVLWGLAVFFIPTIIDAIFGLFVHFNMIQSDYEVCEKCLMDPVNSCSTK